MKRDVIVEIMCFVVLGDGGFGVVGVLLVFIVV